MPLTHRRQIYAPDAMVFVRRGATDAASGINLAAAYARAKTLRPGTSALSASNRAVVLIPPGGYSLSSMLTLDTDFVDLVAVAPAMGGPPIDTDVEWTGTVDAATPVLTHFRPPPTLIYGNLTSTTIAGGAVVTQTANDVRMHGFGIANVSNPGETDIDSNAETDIYACAFCLSPASSNAASVYSQMYFWITGPGIWHTSPNIWMRQSVYSTKDLEGQWFDCISNGHAYRVTANKKLQAVMHNVIAGPLSWCGDDTGVAVGANTRLVNCHGRGIWNLAYQGASFPAVFVPSGFGCMGCRSYSCLIEAGATFIDCTFGDKSGGLGRQNSGTWIRCRFGGYSCGGKNLINENFHAMFDGYAEDCVAYADSFGAGSKAGDNCAGTLVRCRLLQLQETMQLDGAEIRDCYVEVLATAYEGEIDALTLIGNGSKILNSEVRIDTGGAGLPINAASDYNVAFAHCRFNAAPGAHAVNSIDTPYNVVDDQI